MKARRRDPDLQLARAFAHNARAFHAMAWTDDDRIGVRSAYHSAIAIELGLKAYLLHRGLSDDWNRNWFAANNGPNGENLVVLARHSEEVLETVLQLAGRQDLVTARKLAGAREKLREMLEMIDDLQSGQA
ncbi:hypothetical protein [Caulobacter sp.]|uniref:hypothetical protein n=1 Tax=Caulobacter sp. TaxID=78 RepID=UPI0025BDFC3F|nr:hypothetical protein [Caulobacter sp.]MBQ1559328.1 hypothetical protein [Caulobacter sp.]